jgi:hypothetical protein
MVRPDQLFPRGADGVEVDGVHVRKGSVAAFIQNALTLDGDRAPAEERADAAHDLQALVPAMRAINLFDVFDLRSRVVAELVGEVDPTLRAQAEPLDLVAAAMRSSRRRDIDTALRLFSPSCEVRLPQGQFFGHGGLRQFFEREPTNDPRMSVGDPEDVGEGYVLVPVELAGKGKGKPTIRATVVWQIQDQLINRIQGFPGGREAALRSIGRQP